MTIVRTLCTTVLGLCFLASPFASFSSAAESKLVAQVGSVPVTTFELNREQQKLIPLNVQFHGKVNPEKIKEIQAKALSSLIDNAYKVNYAVDKKITIDKKIIDERVENIKKKFKTEKEFKTALGDESMKHFRESIERTLLVEKAEELAIIKNINVTETDIRVYYDTNKHMFKRPKQYKASHIFLKVDPSSNGVEERAALLKKANELAAKAKNGEDFYNLAYFNSDDRSKYVGGDLGYFHEGQLTPELEDVIKKMRVGETSEPFKTMYGFHIIKLVEVNEAKQLEFDEVKVKIREQLEKSAKDSLYKNWMTALKAKYPVKIF